MLISGVIYSFFIAVPFYLLEVSEKPSLPADYFWIPEADIDNYALPRLIEILLATLRS